MEVQEAIAGRRSVRRYKPDPIPAPLLAELLESACWAPSADNTQPWYFVALQGEALSALKERMADVSAAARPHLAERFPNHPEVVRDTTSFLSTLGGAPVRVLAFFQREYPAPDNMLESTAAAVENLLLAAWDRGIGSCWVNAAVRSAETVAWLSRTYAPDKGPLVSMVTLGYPEITPLAPRRRSGRWVIC